MKKLKLKKQIYFTGITTLCLVVIALFIAISCDKVPKYNIYENHDISACGVDDPLRNVEWLKEFCEGLNDSQDFSSVYIYLYKVIDTDEHVFQISIAYSDFEVSTFPYSADWRNCAGEHIFTEYPGVHFDPALSDAFLKDKEYVTELFHVIKQ
ncbi:hypothetical protein FACS1894180_0600 [Bacteroidia bacterium]|nr:hypothetical protein FACS1894178_7700 [Bacteroidia bacterium]GHV42934.1 hypothetical protein FACS1894180_0600 [Bacteroidia bacterium]